MDYINRMCSLNYSSADKYHQIFSVSHQFNRMQVFNLEQLLVNYPPLSNIDELVQADILVFPAERGRFIKDQFLFDSTFSETYQVNFKFYSESQKSLPCILEESFPIEHVYSLGQIATTIVGFYKLYEILVEKTQGKKFRMENWVKFDEDHFVLQKFEGTIEQYKLVRQDFRASLKNIIKSKEK